MDAVCMTIKEGSMSTFIFLYIYTRTSGAYGPLVLEYGDCFFYYYYNCFCWKLGVFEISIMFGNQNIHFWEGLFSKCFFLPLVAVFGFLELDFIIFFNFFFSMM